MTVEEIIAEIENLSDTDKATLNAKLIKNTVESIKTSGWKAWAIRALCVAIGAASAWFTSGCATTFSQANADGSTTNFTGTIIIPDTSK